MSDSGRKRSRKTKLVPRDFSDFIDDDCFLQEPPCKIPFLNKHRKDGESSSGSGSLQFSVKVEVEDIDSLPEEDPSNYMKYLFSLSQDSKQVNHDELDKRIKDLDRTFTMDPQKMFRTFRGLLKKYPHEKEAVIHTRNAWGKVFHEKPTGEPPRYPQDIELQDILSQWKNWLSTTKLKETPFCYKCYICSDAWWTLMDFKNHIRSHDDCSIRLEMFHQECNIIAHMGAIPKPKDIHIDGKCFKCAKTFQQHQDSKNSTDHQYFCTHCNHEFLSCRLLNSHEGLCDKNPIRTAVSDDATNQVTVTEYPCKVCGITFLTMPERYDHMGLCHRVRSDEPITTHGKICRLCNKTFHIFSFHVCEKKNIIHECIHCHGKFQNRQMLESHLLMWDKPFVCSVCDKFVKRQCMGGEHYAKHSDNFLMMYRCLLCTKLKLFYDDGAFRNHLPRTHKRVDSRRPSSDKIIVPKIMLEQCEVNPKGRRGSNVKKTKNLAPVKAATKTKDRRKTNSSTDNQGNEESNSTTAEDNNSILSESSQIQQDSKDILKTLQQITETLDIKPDIIVKDEKLSDTEDSKADLINTIEQIQKEHAKTKTDIPVAVREQSNKFKQIIQEVEEIKLSSILKVTKDVVQPETVIKQEIKDEPEEFEEDLIVLDSSSESIKQETKNSDLGLLDLEPEIILKAGYRKRKTYKCNKCSYEGYHREYKEHISNHCRSPSKDKNKTEPTEDNFTCTKCNESFTTLKKYVQHFVLHNYRFMTCPQCVTMFDSITKLVSHINTHVRTQFVRMQLIHRTEDVEKTKMCQCKICKEVIDLKNTFAHWEQHLEIKAEPEKTKSTSVMSKVMSGSESALEPEVLKRILDLLQNQDRVDKSPPKKVKNCFVCKRYFDRQNDCKRHLVEHLLEDAYATAYQSDALKCQICDDLFRKPDAYKKHMRDHASLPIYQCGLCDKTFSDSSNFTKHKKVHNLKVFVCDICNKKFQAKFSLEKHMEMHMSTDPFRCDRCDRLFYDRSFYRRHMRQHHDRPLARYACMICRQRFASLRFKWDHMWEVHKQRKDKADCPICKKSYRKISDVKKHTLLEHGFNISLSNVFQLVDKYQTECERVTESLKNKKQSADVDASSDDDVLLIEEERETLVIYDD